MAVAYLAHMRMRSTFIATLVVFAALTAGCGSSSPSTPTPAPVADATINIVGISGSSSFAPSPTTVSVGQRVIWKNVDTRTHDIIQDANSFTTPTIAAGAAADPVTMSTRGTFTYHCGIHPSMVGTITVQ
jgi:plastocyanin